MGYAVYRRIGNVLISKVILASFTRCDAPTLATVNIERTGPEIVQGTGSILGHTQGTTLYFACLSYFFTHLLFTFSHFRVYLSLCYLMYLPLIIAQVARNL